MKRWTPEEVEILKQYYPVKGLAFCANLFNVPRHRIRIKAAALGLRQDRNSEFFKDWQSRAAKSKIGKKRPGQSVVMKELHQKGKLVRNAETLKRQGETWSNKLAIQGHPKGMLGKHHSKKSCDAMSKKRKGVKKNLTKEQREQYSIRASNTMQKRMREHGTFHSRGKQAWHIIGGQKHFFRSSWEVEYAKYLQTLLENRKILQWEFEAQTFQFTNTTNGVRSYMPDFRVTNLDNSIEFHEVKGWMDKKSIIKFEKMKAEYPNIPLKVIGKKEYDLLRQYSPTL